MADKLKLRSNTAFTAANTVFGASAVVITVAESSLITQRAANSVILGSVVLGAGSYILQKGPTDTFESNVSIFASSVAI